jgi:hypothetical protein
VPAGRAETNRDPARSHDPDAERARPRIALLAGDLEASELWRLLQGDPGLARFDLVVVAPGAEVALERSAGPAGSWLQGGLEEAALLARSGRVDGLAGVLLADEMAALERAGGPAVLVELLVRGERRVLAAARGAGEVDVARAVSLLVAARRGLERELGVREPAIALCLADGAPVAEVAALARKEGVRLVGPLPAEEAFASSLPGLAAAADLVVTFTRDQTRLGLAIGGREPTARLVLGLPFVRASEDPAERPARAATLRASVLLAARAARLRGELVSEREERALAEKKARLATLAVSARAAREDRCPYCRREFTDDEPPLRCASCDTPHHRSCLHEHGRCTVHGCGAGAVRIGKLEVPIARLGGGAALRVPLLARLGADAGGAEAARGALLLEAPIDDDGAAPARRSLGIELDAREAARGSRLAGTLVIEAPAAFKAAAGTLVLRAALEVRPLEDRPRFQTIVEREAVFLGDPGRSLLGRLSDGVASLLGTSEHVEIPRGTRRYPFSLRLPADHPASVENPPRARGGEREIVTTTIAATLAPISGAALAASVTVVVQ